MNSFSVKLGLYISSFIPLYFLIIVKELIEIANDNLSFNVTNTIMLSFNALLIFLGVAGVIVNYKHSLFEKMEIIDYTDVTCENFLPYFPIFVLFAIAFELEFISMAVVYLLVLIMVGIVYIKNNLFYINPFLNIIGFSTYSVTYKANGNVVKRKKLFVFKKLTSQNLITNNNFIKRKKI